MPVILKNVKIQQRSMGVVSLIIPDQDVKVFVGEKGEQGNTGETGTQGPQGVIGETGSAGATGATGPAGPEGPQGAIGPQCEIGPQGTQGVIGNTGPQGQVGPAGTTDYNDLENKPTLGTAAAQNSTAFATAAQGATADTALQSESDPVAGAALTTHAGLTTGAHGGIVASNDSRLTDARTPLAHGHITGDITGLGTLATQNGTFSGTSSGTNTGDNATNTQYSGLAASKQDTLVSATNIKTINGSSVLGGGNLVVGGAVTISQTEVDFGATPVAEARFTVTDAAATATSKIMGSLAYEAPTGKDLDELEMDALELAFGPNGVGSFYIYAKCLTGYVADKFKIKYQIAA